MTCETRALAIELRTKGKRLEGYAATFNTETRIGGAFIETIAPGAFAASIASGSDILALVDHDPGRVLGRTRSKTLRLMEDTKGLAFDLDLPDTQAGRDVLTLAERGDLGGMSFGFRAIEAPRHGDRRELRRVELFEISVVSAWPAYPETEVQARSHDHLHLARAHAARLLRIMEAQKWAS